MKQLMTLLLLVPLGLPAYAQQQAAPPTCSPTDKALAQEVEKLNNLPETITVLIRRACYGKPIPTCMVSVPEGEAPYKLGATCEGNRVCTGEYRNQIIVLKF